MNWRPPTNTFEVKALSPTDYKSDPNKKLLFGEHLANGLKPFDAALEVFGEDTAAALWASQNWVNDLAVIEIAKKPGKNLKLLDKEAVARKALDFFDEKDPSGRFYSNEGKDRLSALRLYSDICGYTGKTEINPTINNDNRTMNIRLVKPDKKEPEIIDAKPTIVKDADIIPLNVKLVR
jgi:hypothetical protein